MFNRRRPAKKSRPNQTFLRLEHLEDRAVPDATYHDLAGGDFTQDWSDPDLITTDNEWKGVPSIIGYRGDGLSNSTSTDPQTVLKASDVVNVISGSSTSSSTGGIHEIEKNTIALQGSGTADAPYIQIHLNTAGRESVTISYTLKELDSTTVNQLFALQYRIGSSGDFINVSAGAVSKVFDATGNQTKDVSVTLPDEVNDQKEVQVRIITNDAPSSDAMVGIDDIKVTSKEAGSGGGGGTPVVGESKTLEDTISPEPISVTPDEKEGGDTKYYQITNVQGGTVFTDGGKTELKDGSFVTIDQGKEGLFFLPATDLNSDNTKVFSFDIQAAIGESEKELFGNKATATVTVLAVNDAPSFAVGKDISVSEDSGSYSQDGFASAFTPGPDTASDESGQTPTYSLTTDNDKLFASAPAIDEKGNLTFTPADNAFGTAKVTVTVDDGGGTDNGGTSTAQLTFTITINPVADTPTATDQTTDEDTQTPVGVVITPNKVDGKGGSPTHYQITNFKNGTVFLPDGKTQVNDGDFVTAEDAAAGLLFTPDADYFGDASFDVQASLTGDKSGLGGEVVTAQVRVAAIADTPSVTNASTEANQPATNGLVITPNKVDADSVTHYQITDIKNGTLFLNDGKTEVLAGDLILAEEGAAGLVFVPDADFVGQGTFNIQASIADVGLGGDVITATITVRPLLTPTITNATTDEDTETVSGLVITANPADGGATAAYKITNITGGTLFADGVEVVEGDFIAPTAVLIFLPDLDQNGATTPFFGFDVQAATSADDSALGGAVVTATITVNAVNDAPTFDLGTGPTVSEDAPAQSVSNFATNFQPGPLTATDESAQTVGGYVVTAAGSTGTLSFTTAPAIANNGTLTYTVAPNTFGTATFDVVVLDSAAGTSETKTFTITVDPIADTPSVTSATTTEDAQTTSGLVITPNAADGAEVTHFQITGITGGTLFLADGFTAISDGDFISVAQGADGLKFAPAADLNSTFASFSFGVQASIGATISGLGGAVATATITVNAVNDAPTFDLGTGPTVSEDAPAQSVSNFATNFQPGPLTATDEAGQTAASYTVTPSGSTGNLAFTTGPAIANDGTLTYTVAPNTNGTATFTVSVADTGGATSGTKTFTITVTAVNDAPTVTVVGDAVVGQDSGSFLQTGFAALAPGGGTDEAGQTAAVYTVAVTNTTGGLSFSQAPAIAPDGTLSFAPTAGTSGTATVTVTGTDTGGATSAPVTFTITVTPAASPSSPATPSVTPPVLTAASAQIAVVGSDTGPTSQVRVFDAATGAAKFTMSPFGGFTGGVAVAVGDLTGDGIDDVIVATATNGGHVKAYDGSSGAEIRSFFAFEGYFGGVALAAGDVDGDGIADIVVGTATLSSHVKVFSGANGGLIRSFFAYDGFGGGVNVAAGDINGDGRADIATIAGPGGSGHIKAFDGAGLGLLTSFIGYQGYAGPINLAVGDLTGDGLAEIISTAANSQFGTHVKAVNQSGAEVRSFFAPGTAGGAGGASQRTDLVIAPTTPARVGAGNISGSNLAEILLGTGSKAIVLDSNGAMMTQLVNDPFLGLGVYVDV